MRHALGVLGICAAGVLLLVSAAMNWRFGYQLGKTEFDGFIYGSASAAADCMKALVPFFFFAAIKNKAWSQAVASALVWSVVTVYSLTSALGHAALNRADTSGQRSAQVQSYKDVRADLERAKSQLGWVPKHRPAATVKAELAGLEKSRRWSWTNGCTEIKGRSNRAFCEKHVAAKSELASANEAAKLEARIAGFQAKLGGMNGVTHSAEDPQAAVLAKLAGVFVPGVKMEDVQTALTIFVALLLEVGSGLGMYIAFSQWRMYERREPVLEVKLGSNVSAQMTPKAVPAPVAEVVETQPPAIEHVPSQPVVEERPAAEAVEAPRESANDNKTAAELQTPKTDVERYREENVVEQEGSSLTVTALYEDYCTWCDEQNKEPLALPTFGREFGDYGVQKAKIAGRVRYIGIALKSAMKSTEDKTPTVPIVKAA
ncbi:MAG: hypothetical protein KDJ36_06235 [Hyphomicrobiaceae bacterium]|nr:hypothetical protein [Hyphomicrobiaceae bacterium]